jgi:predicted ester cyclase
MFRCLNVFRKKKKDKDIVPTGASLTANASTLVDGKQDRAQQVAQKIDQQLKTEFLPGKSFDGAAKQSEAQTKYMKSEEKSASSKDSSSSSAKDDSSHGDDSSSNDSYSSRDSSSVELGPQMDNDATRELVKRYYGKIWNRGETEDIPFVCSRKFQFNGSSQPLSLEEFKNVVTNSHSGLDLFHAEMHSIVVEGNKAFCRMLFTGIHNDEYLGYRPTGKNVSWEGATEFTIKNSRIQAVWELADLQSLKKQLQG